MNPIEVPANRLVQRFVAVTPVNACGPYRQNPAMQSAEAPKKPDAPPAGRNQNAAKSAAVIAIRNTQRRGARPPKMRSVAQPANSIPTMPANSKNMMTVPDSLGVKPFAS